MKSFFTVLLLLSTISIGFSQNTEEQAVTAACMDYLDGFYNGETDKIKRSLSPKLYKFGYWKNKDSGEYEFSNQMTFEKAVEYAQRVKDKGEFRHKDAVKEVKILDVSNHIAAAKVIAWWGVDYLLLSKNEEGKWIIHQVIWEGPLEKGHQGK